MKLSSSEMPFDSSVSAYSWYRASASVTCLARRSNAYRRRYHAAERVLRDRWDVRLPQRVQNATLQRWKLLARRGRLQLPFNRLLIPT